MKISAIVPIFNTSIEILEKSLKSIASQICTCDYEVILVDDGSDAKIHNFLETFVEENPRCKIITHQINKGASAARNTGIANATGDYIYFPDSDDILLPGAIEKVHEVFVNNPDISFVSFGWLEKKQSHEKICRISKTVKMIQKDEIINYLCADSFFKGYLWNKVFNLNVLGNNLPQFNTQLKVFEDKIWILELGNKLISACLLPDILYSYEYNPNSITRSKETLRKRQFMYYAANRIIVSLSKHFGLSAYYNALEYFFSLAWNDYFYWMFVSHFSYSIMKENAEVVNEILNSLPSNRIHSPRNKLGLILFIISYRILRQGK